MAVFLTLWLTNRSDSAKIRKICDLTQYFRLFIHVYAQVYDLAAGFLVVRLPEGFGDTFCESCLLFLFHGAKIHKRAGTSQSRLFKIN